MISMNDQPGNGIAADEARECLVSMRRLDLAIEHQNVGCGSLRPPILSRPSYPSCCGIQLTPPTLPFLFRDLESSSRCFILWTCYSSIVRIYVSCMTRDGSRLSPRPFSSVCIFHFTSASPLGRAHLILISN